MRLYLREQGEFLDEYSALERAWLAVYFVQVSKLQLFCGPRKSPLNIETKEFCQLVRNLGFGPWSLKSLLAHIYGFTSRWKGGIPGEMIVREKERIVVCKYQRPLSCVGKENYFAGNIWQN